MANETLVIIPTYNEVENLPLIVGRVLDTPDEVDILVVDDNSPDGTGKKADELADTHAEVHVLHREGKEGLMAAYRDGFRWALERDYAVICQMDADGSHAPEELELLLQEIASGADMVIGSRYVEGGEVKNWPKNRLVLSEWGNQYIALALGTEIKDMTAGYRAFRREVLEELDLEDLSQKGFIFQVEIAHKAEMAGFEVREVPITFEDRKLGESKLDASFAVSSLAEVTKWSLQDRAELVAGFVGETGRQAVRAFETSPLAEIGPKVDAAPEKIVNAIIEFGAVAKHELDNANLDRIPRKLARGVNTGLQLADETVRQARYALRGR